MTTQCWNDKLTIPLTCFSMVSQQFVNICLSIPYHEIKNCSYELLSGEIKYSITNWSLEFICRRLLKWNLKCTHSVYFVFLTLPFLTDFLLFVESMTKANNKHISQFLDPESNHSMPLWVAISRFS